MSWITEIEQEDSEQLSKRVWNFAIYDMPRIHLQSVIDMSRPSKRHKYKVDKIWKRIDQRSNTMERIEPPNIIKAQVRERLNAAILFD
jgi:hypothetical protein